MLVVLISLRIFSVFLPQSGYIHPDEFFQSVEIVAGDVLHVTSQRTWEFNATSPIRSVIFPYIISWPPFWMLKNSCLSEYLSPYLVLILPRIVIALIGLINDLCIYKLGSLFHVDGVWCATFHAISYIAWTYYSRTLSNSLECALFSLLLAAVFSAGQIRQKYRSGEYRMETTGSNTVAVAIFVVFGVFNRPTFVLFCIVPVLFWVYSMCRSSILRAFAQCVQLATVGACVAFLCILLDSMYYRHSLWEMVDLLSFCTKQQDRAVPCVLEFVKTDLVFTPWNFIQYNMDGANLASHGLHPRYLHATVNLPLLFGPLLPCLLLSARILVASYRHRCRSHDLWLVLCFSVPVTLLSLFPHQEPRFLIPLLPLAIILTLKVLKHPFLFKVTFYLWIVFNLIMTLFYGIIHQGGLVPSMLYLQNHLATSRDSNLKASVVFWHTYMPPSHLLLLKTSTVEVLDLAGADYSVLERTVHDIKAGRESRELLVVLPSTVLQHLEGQLAYSIIRKFYPHLSTEDPPDISKLDFDSIADLLSLYVIKV